MTTRHEEQGFILALVLVILAILTVFAVSMTLLSQVNIQTAGNINADQQALNIAFSRFNRAQQYIIDRGCTFNDQGGSNLLDDEAFSIDNPGVPDGHLDAEDTFGHYDISIKTSRAVTCEMVLENSSLYLKKNLGMGILSIQAHLKSCARPEVERDHFLITATGVLEGVKKNITARVEHKSFLDFARFTLGNLSYGDDVTIEGEVYCGGTLSVSNGCRFKENVYVKNGVSGSGATFEKGYDPGYKKTISLDLDNQINDYYDEACTCGWVISANPIAGCAQSGDRYVLGNSRFTGSDNLLEFDNFKDLDDSMPNPPNQPRYEGNGTHILPSNFNGIVIWDDSNSYDLYVKGRLGEDEDDGLGNLNSITGRGKSMLVLARTRNIRIDSWIRTGTNHELEPVNIGLLASGTDKRVIFEGRCPNWMINNAAIMVTKATSSCWKREGSQLQSYVHDTYDNYTIDIPANNTYYNKYRPCLGVNPCQEDIDNNGIIETAAQSSYGWNEVSFDPRDCNVLVQWGPIITRASGDAGPWHVGFPASNGSASTRIYHYDPDIIKYPPPFPKINNLLHLVSYAEFDTSFEDD